MFELGHDLHARDHRGRRRRGRHLSLAQHAVDAVADVQPVLGRFDVDVGCARLDGSRDDLVDQADDRRFAGEVAQPLDIGIKHIEVCRHVVAGSIVRALTGLATVQSIERCFQLGRYCDRAPNRSPDQQRDCIFGKPVERVGHGHEQAVWCVGDWQQARFAQESEAQTILKQRPLGIFLGADERQLEDSGGRFGEVAFGNQAEFSQHMKQRTRGCQRPDAERVRYRADRACLGLSAAL